MHMSNIQSPLLSWLEQEKANIKQKEKTYTIVNLESNIHNQNEETKILEFNATREAKRTMLAPSPLRQTILAGFKKNTPNERQMPYNYKGALEEENRKF